jgi:chromate reductase
MTELRFAGIVGSLRKGSNSRAVMATLPDLAPRGVRFETPDIGSLPFYDEDMKAGGSPPVVVELARRLEEADAVVFVSPEYNRSIPGVLKNAIDWLSKEPNQPFWDKPVAVITHSPGLLGGIAANHHLRQVLAYLGPRILTGPEVAIGSIKTKLSDGRIADEATRGFVATELARLAAICRPMEAGSIEAEPVGSSAQFRAPVS